MWSLRGVRAVRRPAVHGDTFVLRDPRVGGGASVQITASGAIMGSRGPSIAAPWFEANASNHEIFVIEQLVTTFE